MLTQVQKIGKSLGVIIPSQILNAMKIKAGDRVDVSTANNQIVIRPIYKRPKYTLDELLEKCDFDEASNKELMEWERIAPLDREINDQE